MKTGKYLIAGLLFLLSNNTFSGEPSRGCTYKYSFWYDWSANLSAGFTSYYGDLSQYDIGYLNKLMYESKPAVAFKLTKQIMKNRFGVSGQLLWGGFKSNYKPEHIFETTIFEYNIQASANIMNIINPYDNPDFGITVFAGAGQFLFGNSVYSFNDGLELKSTGGSRVPEFVYFFGAGFYQRISDSFDFTIDLSIRQAQNDNLDSYIAHGDFDYYSFLSVGITFKMDNLRTPFNRFRECPAYERVHPPLKRDEDILTF